MMSENELDALDKGLSTFRLQTSQHHDALQDLTQNYHQLLESYRRLRSDYEEEKDARERYKKLARGQERNPFVLVLVDGDGYIFDDHLVKGGVEGGVQAANLLNATIKERLLRMGGDYTDARIMVRVYSNMAGLSKALSRVNLCQPHARSLAPFAASFTRAHELFDFVDAGDKKENADFKIREMFRLFADNSQCKHVFFAGCHDNGYLSMLTPFIAKSDKITLVKAAYLHPDYNSLQLRIEDFPGVFRASPIDTDNYRPTSTGKGLSASSGIPVRPQPFHSGPPPPIITPGKPCTHFLKGICRFGDKCSKFHPLDSPRDSWRPNKPSFVQNGRLTPPGRTESAYSRQADGLSDDESEDNLSIPQKPGFIAVNKDGHRLDARLKPATEKQHKAYIERANIHKLCNKYQLSGYCKEGSACSYDHGPISDDLKHVLKLLTHDYPCPRGGDCRVENCASGHQCYRKFCQGAKRGCRLNRFMHGIDPHWHAFDTAIPLRIGDKNAEDQVGEHYPATKEEEDAVNFAYQSSDEEVRVPKYSAYNAYNSEDSNKVNSPSGQDLLDDSE